jgi:hypothetical protein
MRLSTHVLEDRRGGHEQPAKHESGEHEVFERGRVSHSAIFCASRLRA